MEERKIFTKKKDVYCYMCNELIDKYKYDLTTYVYKCYKKTKLIYFCSYTCQIKYEKYIESHKNHGKWYRYNDN